MLSKSFVERVRDEAIRYSKPYQHRFVDYEYLIFSNEFKHHHYYILNFQQQNYLHLIGVNSFVSPIDFFNKCYHGTLSTQDFDFNKKGGADKTKGSVRRKIYAFNGLINLFEFDLYVEENFHKNNVTCALASTDTKSYTLGMINSVKHKNLLYPMSLMKGDETNSSKKCKVDLVLRKPVGELEFNKIIIGNIKLLATYLGKIAHIPLNLAIN